MRYLVVLAILIVVALPVPTAVADDETESGSSGSGFWVNHVESETAPGPGSGPTQPLTDGSSSPVLLGDGACNAADSAAGEFLNVSFCEPQQQYAEPVLTTALIRRAFAELPLPAGELVIQPPDGLTLVNFDTNFYTTSTRPIRRTVTLLGQRVTLEATPATFHWDFDDGRSLATSEPGAPYPRLDVTHNYLRTGTYRPSLSTTYSGRFRVGGGAWQQIPGTVTIDGAGQALRAIEAEPKLVGY